MAILISLALLILIPVLAFRGYGFRGLYIAGILAGVAIGFFAVEISGGPLPPVASPAEARGAEFLDAYGFDFALAMFAGALACAIGAALYRSRGPRATDVTASSMTRCPFCAEQIQSTAIVCRFCDRSLEQTQEQ